MKDYIDISTKEKKEEALKRFLSFEKIGDIYNYYGISDNSQGVKYVKNIAQEVGFDLTWYKEKKKRFCKNCGKELVRGQTKFCSCSCSATYNNAGRTQKEETKEKIREKLKKDKTEQENLYSKEVELLICQCCGKEFKQTHSGQKYCSSECSTKYRHMASYSDFLTNYEKYNRGNYTPKAFRNEFMKEQGNKCAICGCNSEHNGKPLVFVLDHIDGDASNNKRENLRMICPNCDSQLPTFKSKNKNSTRRNYWKENILKNIKN